MWRLWARSLQRQPASQLALSCRYCSASTTTQPAATAAACHGYGTAFTVSPRAWHQIHNKNTDEGFANDTRHLRLSIDSGGCHGFLYKFAFEPSSSAVEAEGDVVIPEADVVAPTDEQFTGADPSPRVVVDTTSISKLEGAVLDYHSELKGSAFVVIGNALVDQSCACAMSFSLRPKNARAGASARSSGITSAEVPKDTSNATTGSARGPARGKAIPLRRPSA